MILAILDFAIFAATANGVASLPTAARRESQQLKCPAEKARTPYAWRAVCIG
jgi:hypothetical protein